MTQDFDKNAIPESGSAPGAGRPSDAEGGQDKFRLGLKIAAFLGALMFLLGLAGAWMRSQEEPMTGTITAVGPVSSHTRRDRRHGSSRTITTAPMTVRFEDGGETREETLTFRIHSQWIVPRPGQTAQITKNPFGVYVAWPDTGLETVSYVLMIIGGIILAFALFMLRSMSNAERESLIRSAEISREGETPPVAQSDEVTDRVTLQPNGFYSWYGRMDNAYYRNQQYNGLKLFIGILLVILVILGALTQSGEFMLLVAGIFGFVVLLTLGLIHLTVHGEGVTRELYTMCDEWVRAGSGKASSFFTFSKARQVLFMPRYIELHGRVKTLRVYVPAEDMPFVSDYIRSRLLPGTDVKEP